MKIYDDLPRKYGAIIRKDMHIFYFTHAPNPLGHKVDTTSKHGGNSKID
jgi:hypothetical protein